MLASRRLHQPAALLERVRQRLFHNHIDAPLKAVRGNRGMRVVRRGDMHNVRTDGLDEAEVVRESRNTVGGHGGSEPPGSGSQTAASRAPSSFAIASKWTAETSPQPMTAAFEAGHESSIPFLAASDAKARAAVPKATGPEKPPSSWWLARWGSREAKPA